MRELARTVILGTDQVAPSAGDETGTAADALVSALGDLDRERAILLRAGALAILHRAGRVIPARERSVAAAATETLRRPSEKLAHALESLLESGNSALLEETLERLGGARIRLPEELLPLALSKTAPALRQRLKPVLGERGLWLSQFKESWRWGRSPVTSDDVLPPDLTEQWADGTSQERAALLAAAARLAPDVARKLVAESWKQEKAEQRLAWLEIFERGVSAADEPWLVGALSDRSANVRMRAARILWCLPDSEVGRRARERVDSLVRSASEVGGMLGKLKKLAGGGRPKISIELPPDTFDPTWEREGIVETPPQGVGRRQWWLTQMIAAVPPTYLEKRIGIGPAPLVEAFVEHELGAAAMDGVTTSALREGARDWFSPLWDAWLNLEARAPLTENPLHLLTGRLSSDEIEPRALRLLEKGARLDILAGVARPWPPRLARAFLTGLSSARLEWMPLLSVASLALPVEVIPEVVAVPESSGDDAALQVFLRAFDQFQSTLALRRAIAKEIES